MIPEVEITCKGKDYFINSIKVEQYKKYIALMEKNDSVNRYDAMFYNKKILQEALGNELPLAAIGTIPAYEFLLAVKTIHFIMQDIVTEKMVNILKVEKVEKQESAFDEYDRENGYEDLDQEPEEDNPWKIYMEIVDRIIKISIRLLKNSYSQSMKEDMIALCDYIKFELDTMDENQ